MADYHPLIARAVAGLEKNTGEARRALYERARTALVAQLRGVTPALDESEITRERLALEEAIRKVEAESARQARETARAPQPKRTDVPHRTEMPRSNPIAARPSTIMPRSGAAAVAQRSTRPLVVASTPPAPNVATPAATPSYAPPPAAARSVGEPQPAAEPLGAPTARSTGGSRTLSDEALRGFRDVVTDSAPPVEPRRGERNRYDGLHEPSLPPAPTLQIPEPHPLEQYGQLEPQVPPESLWALPLEGARPGHPVDFDHGHPPSLLPGPHPQPEQAVEEVPVRPSRPPRPVRSYGGLIRTALLLILVGAVASVAYWQRDTIGGAASGLMALLSGPGTKPSEPAAPTSTKITDRLGQPAEPAPSMGLPVAQRVVLYEEDPADPQGKRFVGNVVWRTEMKPAVPGRPPELGVRADIEVPERTMSVTWSLRRNTDQSLPASHTIEIVFNLPQDSSSGGVQNVPGVLMKQAEQTRGVPLAGLAVKVTPGYFLIGLSALETDVARNIQLLKERAWFDIPIVYNNNRRAILAMEKGTSGETAFGEVFAAWKQ